MGTSSRGRSEESLVTTREAQGLAYWIERPYVAPDLRNDLRSAGIVLLPLESFRDRQGPLFPVGTEQLLTFLKNALPEGVKADIACDDEHYRELAIHGDIVMLAGVLATSVVAPVAVNLIAEYLKRRLWPSQRPHEVRFTLALEDPETGRAIALSYEGPAGAFEASMKKALDGVSPRTPEAIEAGVRMVEMRGSAPPRHTLGPVSTPARARKRRRRR